MTGDVFGLRCARCLWSVLGTEPRQLAADFGKHACDPADVAYLTAVRLLDLVFDTKEDNQ